MTDEKQSKGTTETKQDKSVFVLGMVGVIDQPRTLIKEHRPRLFKGHAVLA